MVELAVEEGKDCVELEEYQVWDQNGFNSPRSRVTSILNEYLLSPRLTMDFTMKRKVLLFLGASDFVRMLQATVLMDLHDESSLVRTQSLPSAKWNLLWELEV